MSKVVIIEKLTAKEKELVSLVVRVIVDKISKQIK